MALIECPNCKKQISDKALSCPACGVQINHDVSQQKVCCECNTLLSINDKTCPNCGCPVENDNTSTQKVEVTNIKLNKMNKQKKSVVIVSLVLVVAIIAGILGYSAYSKQKGIEEYQNNLSLVTSTMLIGAVNAEDAANLIHDVWYNTIYEEYDSKTDKYTRSSGYGFNDDFNDSLQALFADSSFTEQINEIEENQELVNSLMKSLTNPPEEYTDAYLSVKELYDVYLDLTNCAISPTGSLTTFTSTFNEADTNFANAYDSIKMYVD